MWKLDYKESLVAKNWCFWTVVLEKTLESPLDCKEIQPVHPKGNQSWVFIGRTDAEAELQYFGHLMQRDDSLEKTLILGKVEGRRRRGQQRMKWLDGNTESMDMSFEWTPGVGDRQGGLACCGSWSRKESDMTEQLELYCDIFFLVYGQLILVIILYSGFWSCCFLKPKSDRIYVPVSLGQQMIH